MVLLRTKLFAPPTHQTLIERPRLFNLLEQNRCPAFLIEASAGSGKSTLVSQWLGKSERNFCWYSLDSSDNSIDTFLLYMVEALRGVIPSIGTEALSLQAAETEGLSESALMSLINEIIFDQTEITFVLDDFHLIDDENVHAGLLFLLEHLPPNLTLIIITRSTPPFSLSRLKSRHILHELTQKELSFTPDEIEIYCNSELELNLSGEAVEQIYSKTEGWATALHLCTLCLDQCDTQSEVVSEFAGDNQYVFDYLMEEVLEQLPGELKEFLFVTSLFERFNNDLSDTLLGSKSSGELLRLLEQRNIFLIPLDKKRKWYRYHHLLTPLLASHLPEERKRELALTGARWFHDEGFYREAFRYAVTAGDFSFALDIFGLFAGKVWKYEKVTSNYRLLLLLPEQFLRSDPRARMYLLREVHLMREYDRVPAMMEGLEEELGEIADPALRRQMIARFNTIEARFALATDQYELSVAKSRKALENLPGSDLSWRGAILTALSWSVLFRDDGKVSEAVKLFTEARKIAVALDEITTIIDTYYHEMVGERILGHLDRAWQLSYEAFEYLREYGLDKSPIATVIMIEQADLYVSQAKPKKALELAERARFYVENNEANPSAVHNVYTRLVGVYIGLGMNDQAYEALGKAKEISAKHFFPLWIMGVQYVLAGILYFITKNHQELQKWIEETKVAELPAVTAANEPIFMIYGWWLFSQKREDEAIALYEEIVEKQLRGERFNVVLASTHTLFNFHYLRNEPELMEKHLIDYLNMNAKTGIVAHLFIEIERMDELLLYVLDKRLYERDEALFSREFIEQLRKVVADYYKEFVEPPKPVKNDLAKINLSSREVVLLEHIAEGKTNQKIADAMFISVNTVKTHLKNINVKLDVSTRTEAVMKAQQMGLLAFN